MNLVVRAKRRFAASTRKAVSSNLTITKGLNSFMGRVRPGDYVPLIDYSEGIDPIADIDALVALRKQLASGSNSPRYPNRIESVNRIYGIKSSIFGERAEDHASPSIEHGLFFGDYIYPADTVFTAAPTIATMSEYRRSIIQKHQDLPVFTTGPYIQYATPHYEPQRIAAIKQVAGRTALVFPAHTTDDSRAPGSAVERLGWIDKIADGFDTVLVSVFWWDLLNSDVNYLRSRGYQVVSCGVTHDRRFLDRQRTLFQLTDAVFSDGVGTHIGYALNEGHPVSLGGASEVELDMSHRSWMADAQSSRQSAVSEITRVLNECPGDLERQRRLVGSYWGLGTTRTEDERRAMARLSGEIARRARGATRRYPQVARVLLAELERSGAFEDASLLRESLPHV